MKLKTITAKVETKAHRDLQKALDEHGISFSAWLRDHINRSIIMRDFRIQSGELEMMRREQDALREKIRREMANKSPELFQRYFPNERIEDWLNVEGTLSPVKRKKIKA